MSLPLSDIKVVDFATVLAGPFTAMFLADQGADVIKIEPPGGESARRLTPSYPDSNGLSLGFLTFNRNKRSVVLDITKPKGLEAAYKLFQWADVLVINIQVESRQRRGISYEHAAAVNPRLVYVSLTAFGERGPDAVLGGVDITNQGRAGDLEARRPPGGPLPPHTQLFHFDMATAMVGAYAIMLALRQREQTGRGQKVELTLLHTAMACQAIQMTRRVGSEDSYAIQASGMPNTYEGSDGRSVMAGGLGPQWEAFCRTIGLDHLITDPRFDTAEKRTQNMAQLAQVYARHFATRPAAEWATMLKRAGRTATLVQKISELYDDPQVIANEMIVAFDQPGFGTIKAVSPPFRLSANATEPLIRAPAPTTGEHTAQVLQQLGYSQDDIQAMAAEGVFG